jgi:hypothetical protein
MKPEQPNPASAKDQTEGSRDTKDGKKPEKCGEDFGSKVDLPGKTDSGPEPDVFGREIPPQD